MENTGDIRIDDIMPRLNEAWVRVPFEECLLPTEPNYRKLRQVELQRSGLIPVIDQGEDFIAGYTDKVSNKYPGSLPVVIFGDHTRRVKYVDFEFAVGADGVKLLHPFSALDPQFFYYYLLALKLESQGYSRHFRFLREIDVPIPSFNEQRRIVAKLEKLLSRVDAAQARLATIPSIFKRFRQSVLAAACSGKLTADWRTEERIVETATELVFRVQRERQRTHERDIDEADRRRLRKPKRPKDDLVAVADEDAELLVGWCMTAIGKISDCLDHKRKPINKQERLGRQGAIPYYGANGQVGWIDDFIFNEDLVLVVEDETFIGREKPFSYVIKGKTWVNNHAHVLRPLGGISVEFLNFCLSYYDFTPLTSGTTGRRKLNQDALLKAPMVLPPLAEQKEIVRRVGALFKTAYALEERYRTAKTHVDKLTKTILAKAFRGELVPQDPNDEPASALLNRIKTTRDE